jgi:hypothetical protein
LVCQAGSEPPKPLPPTPPEPNPERDADKGKINLGMILGIIFGVLVLLIIVGCIYLQKRKNLQAKLI